MHPESIIESLIEAEVLVENSDGVTLHSDFRSHLDSIGVEDQRDWSHFALIQEAILSRLPDRLHSPEIVLFIQQIEEGFPPSTAVPDNFLPIYGDQLPPLVEHIDRVIAYVWRHDCPPCERMRESLENVDFASQEIVGVGIYGPDHPNILRKEYSVVGGPTTLIFKRSDVDVRLHGAYPEEVIAAELDKSFNLD